jgi:uncharacterized protein (DUF2164 family)
MARKPLTFAIKSPQDMVEKLSRELDRIFEYADDEKEIADHGINFCMTAWHLREWVWAAIKANHQLRAALAKELGIRPQAFNSDQFVEYLLMRTPELEYCQGIATSAKHIGAEVREFETDTSAAPTLTGDGSEMDRDGSEMDRDRSEMDLFKWKLKLIEPDGRRIDAGPVFKCILTFWAQFVDEHCR